MTGSNKKNKAAWIAAGALVVGAIITGLLNNTQKSNPTQTIKQDTKSGTNNAAGRDINQAGRDIIQAQGPVSTNNYYGDTSKKKTVVHSGSSGDHSNNVTTYDQHGGLAVGQLIVIKNATFLQKGPNPAPANDSDNYSCVIDINKKWITIQPKTGDWNNPFIAFPCQELTTVVPHFFNAIRSTVNVDTASYTFDKQDLFGLSTKTTPSTAQLSYSLHYQDMPTKVIFGNYPAPLYEVILKK